MPLRNEDYVAFLDESGDATYWVVSGLLVPARWLRSAERRWKDFVKDRLGSRSGRTEVHARELVAGQGISLHAQQSSIARHGQPISAKAAGRQFYRDALEHIAKITEARVLTVGMKTRQPVDVYRLWYWLAFAALIKRAKSPRPRLPLVVIDGEDAALRDSYDLIAYRMYKHFGGRQPYLRRGPAWVVGGSVHQNSELLPFIQMADLVAFVARQAIARQGPAKTWYQKHLREYALELTPHSRNIDISAHALSELRRRSPKDKVMSDWAHARLVP